MREPFFAALSRRIDKTASTNRWCPRHPTAQFELLYNPEFMGALKDEHQLGVLMHEFYHIVFEHVTGRKPADGLKRMLSLLWTSLSMACLRWLSCLEADLVLQWLAASL